MPYCEGSSSAVVTITLNGNSARVISNSPPVDYTLKELREPGQCPDVNYSIFAWYRVHFPRKEERKGVVAVVGKLISCSVTPSRVYSSWQRSSGVINNFQHAPPSGSQWIPERGYEILPTFGVPDACGDIQGCELEVTDQSGVIWRSSGDTCPSVSVQCGDECCPNQQALEAQMGRILARLDQLK